MADNLQPIPTLVFTSLHHSTTPEYKRDLRAYNKLILGDVEYKKKVALEKRKQRNGVDENGIPKLKIPKTPEEKKEANRLKTQRCRDKKKQINDFMDI